MRDIFATPGVAPGVQLAIAEAMLDLDLTLRSQAAGPLLWSMKATAPWRWRPTCREILGDESKPAAWLIANASVR
jgi:hypothetical protein